MCQRQILTISGKPCPLFSWGTEFGAHARGMLVAPQLSMTDTRHGAWTVANMAAAIFFIGFLAVQLLVPIIRLGAERRPARYAWQMYSTYVPPVVFLRESPSGSLDTIQVSDHVARPRGDIDLARYLPRHICSRDTGAAAVLVVQGVTTNPARHSCP